MTDNLFLYGDCGGEPLTVSNNKQPQLFASVSVCWAAMSFFVENGLKFFATERLEPGATWSGPRTLSKAEPPIHRNPVKFSGEVAPVQPIVSFFRVSSGRWHIAKHDLNHCLGEPLNPGLR